MGFKLRSSGPFKMMGSSPVKQDEKEDTRTGEVKKLDATLDQIDRAKLYQASQKDQLTRETTGTRGTEFKKSYLETSIKRKGRGLNMRGLVSMTDTGIPITTTSTTTPSYAKDGCSVKNGCIDPTSISAKEREKRFKKQGGYDSGENFYTTFDAENNIATRHITSTDTHRSPKADMPTFSLEQKTPELNTTPPEPVVKKAKLPPELRPEKKKVKKKRTKVKRVKRPKGTKTRNLVTGGKNRTRRSTGTSKRKNRVIAGLTFWNSKD